MSKTDTLWYTRCPVPTPLGIASQLGWIDDEFRADGIKIRTLQDETDPALRESHFDHRLENSFRQGGNIPAIWAKSRGRETKVVGLTWTDEAQVILVRSDSDIRTVADLQGRRLGVATRPNDSIDFWKATTIRAYVAALGLYGLDHRDVELVELPRQDKSLGGATRGWASAEKLEQSLEAQALLSGDVDVIFHKGSRGLELADAIGARIVYDVGAHPDPKVRVNNGSPRTLTVDAALLEREPELVARLVKQVLLAGRWAEEHPSEAVAYVARETGSTESAVARAYTRVHEALKTDLEPSSIAALDDFTRFLHDWKFIPNAVDVQAWIDPRPLQQARALLAAEARSAKPRGSAAVAPSAI
jgi:ABC-type nitrate/sulfonate/bicarbonate transport system substrate-binding protein